MLFNSHQRAEQVRALIASFDQAARAMDQWPVRFFDINARALAAAAGIAPGARVLDVATGTGKAARAAARAAGPSGRVAAIDLSRGMLAQARRMAGDLAIDFVVMDAEHIGFCDDSFDIVLCAFGIFYLSDMRRGLDEMRRVLRPHGRVALSTWTQDSFEPLYALYHARLSQYGVSGAPPPGEAWLYQPAHVKELLQQAGFGDVRVLRQNTGYALQDLDEWWTVVAGSALRGHLNQLSAEALDAFVGDVNRDFSDMFAERGLYLDASAHIATGTK